MPPTPPKVLLTKMLMSKMPEVKDLGGTINAMNLHPSVFDKIVSKKGRDDIHILMDPIELVNLIRFCAIVARINASNKQQQTDKFQACVRLLEQLDNKDNKYYTGTIVGGVPHKVALTYLGKAQCLQHIPDTQIGDIPVNQTHALEILFRDQSAVALLKQFVACVSGFAQMTALAKKKKQIAQKEDNKMFDSAKTFMIRSGCPEDKAAASLRGSQPIINQKHFGGQSATTMVLLANPHLGDVNNQDARALVQKKTIPHFASPLYHARNQHLRACQMVIMHQQVRSGLAPNPTAAARTVPQLHPLTDHENNVLPVEVQALYYFNEQTSIEIWGAPQP